MTSIPEIVLCGATGRTGNAVAHALVGRRDCGVAALVAPSVAGTPSRQLPVGMPAFASLAAALESTTPTVLVDLTHAEPALEHATRALERGIPVVIGATGIDEGTLGELGEAFTEAKLGLLLVPNFSIGAVVMMQLAERAAAHFTDVEIVETHHAGKRDAPSGTARLTAERIARARSGPGSAMVAGDSPSRGESICGIPVHALRLAGPTAHQHVVFGSDGEVLTIRHDAIDRGCYAHGVVRAASGVARLRGLHIGLEHVL